MRWTWTWTKGTWVVVLLEHKSWKLHIWTWELKNIRKNLPYTNSFMTEITIRVVSFQTLRCAIRQTLSHIMVGREAQGKKKKQECEESDEKW